MLDVADVSRNVKCAVPSGCVKEPGPLGWLYCVLYICMALRVFRNLAGDWLGGTRRTRFDAARNAYSSLPALLILSGLLSLKSSIAFNLSGSVGCEWWYIE